MILNSTTARRARSCAWRTVLGAVLAVSSLPLSAQPGPWGRPGWDPGDGLGRTRSGTSSAPDPREGRVQVEQFLADGAAPNLGHGSITVAAMPGGTTAAQDQARYEAAVIDQLVKSGYDTLSTDAAKGQVAEIRIVRDVVVPEEAKRSPVSGSMMVGASNRGTMTAMAVEVDLSKPRKALLSTRLEARLRDRATGQLLWEGRATIVTREGDSHWTEQTISSRLAGALFEKLPVAERAGQRDRPAGDATAG